MTEKYVKIDQKSCKKLAKKCIKMQKSHPKLRKNVEKQLRIDSKYEKNY